jgi:type 1 glutamine amidotransferase
MTTRSPIIAAIAGIMAICSAAAQARPVTDCPLRDAPFSTASPLIDILANSAAKAVIDRYQPGLLAHLPAMMTATTAPSFAAIVDMREMMVVVPLMSRSAPFGTDAQVAAKLAAIDAALRKLPVTAADRAARCRRYDNTRPAFALPPGRPRLLLFEKITGFRDAPSVDAARAAFLSLARANGWGIVVTDKGGAITRRVLRHFDAVIWNNISGDVLTLAQRAALRAFVERGGGFVGVHGAAGDPVTWWDWYTDTLIGARFAGHPFPDQFQQARVAIDTADQPLAQGLPREWTITEEWYSFRNNPRAGGSRVLATLDEATYDPVLMGTRSLRMGDHPIAWSRCIGQGRMVYSAIGHRPEIYDDPVYRRMLRNAIAWAATHDASQCR